MQLNCVRRAMMDCKTAPNTEKKDLLFSIFETNYQLTIKCVCMFPDHLGPVASILNPWTLAQWLVSFSPLSQCFWSLSSSLLYFISWYLSLYEPYEINCDYIVQALNFDDFCSNLDHPSCLRSLKCSLNFNLAWSEAPSDSSRFIAKSCSDLSQTYFIVRYLPLKPTLKLLVWHVARFGDGLYIQVISSAHCYCRGIFAYREYWTPVMVQ